MNHHSLSIAMLLAISALDVSSQDSDTAINQVSSAYSLLEPDFRWPEIQRTLPGRGQGPLIPDLIPRDPRWIPCPLNDSGRIPLV